MSNNSKNNLRYMNVILILAILCAVVIDTNVFAQPNGAAITSNTTETAPVQSAGAIATAGGSFTTLILNATSQNPRWKAYVGNISGGLRLADANSQTIYDWDLTIITGEVYASRNDSITWGSIGCADRVLLASEDAFLNMTNTQVDAINNTFNDTVHQGFFTGSTQIVSSSCPAIATYINSSRQATGESADFQEILLDDGTNLVYATIIENNAQGYHNGTTFDFQMILAENELNINPTTYYFYAELG